MFKGFFRATKLEQDSLCANIIPTTNVNKRRKKTHFLFSFWKIIFMN